MQKSKPQLFVFSLKRKTITPYLMKVVHVTNLKELYSS